MSFNRSREANVVTQKSQCRNHGKSRGDMSHKTLQKKTPPFKLLILLLHTFPAGDQKVNQAVGMEPRSSKRRKKLEWSLVLLSNCFMSVKNLHLFIN
jgi:hypothetical protein